jgi:hypothetical protein
MTTSRPASLADPAPTFLDACRRHQLYLHGLLIFTASRAVVAIGASFGALLPANPPPWPWDPGNAWYTRLLRWDSAWYSTIIVDGYRYTADPAPYGSTGLFPLYPLVCYVVKSLFGIDANLALFLVANLAAVAVALLMIKFVRDEIDDDVALATVALFCFFPFSLFLSAGYTESLSLMFMLLGLILARRGQFVLAAAMAGLALATRSTGIVMLPVILWEMWQRDKLPWPYLLPKMALCGLIAVSGLLAYMAYLGVAFGNPFAFATTHASWEGGTLWQRVVAAATLAPFRNFDVALGGWFVCFVLLTIWSFTRLRFAVSLYALGTLALPYFTVGITGSTNRFVLMCVPAFMLMGLMCRGKPWLTGALIGIFAALLATDTALFSRWYWVG